MTDARDFLTVRLAKDDRVDDVGGLVFVELEDSQGRSIDWPNRYTDNSGNVCIDIPVNGASIIESQRAEIERLMEKFAGYSDLILAHEEANEKIEQLQARVKVLENAIDPMDSPLDAAEFP